MCTLARTVSGDGPLATSMCPSAWLLARRDAFCQRARNYKLHFDGEWFIIVEVLEGIEVGKEETDRYDGGNRPEPECLKELGFCNI